MWVYDHSSPINILGIPYLGKFFGKDGPIPSSDNDGTKIASSVCVFAIASCYGF